MAVNFKDLACWVQQNREPLLTGLPWGSPSINYLSHRTGIKCQEAIGTLGVETQFQDCSCDPTPAGEINFSDRILAVSCIEIYDTICDLDFLCTRYEQEVRRTAGRESIGRIEEWIVQSVLLDVAYKHEIAIWQGDTDSPNTNLNKFDGLLKIMNADVPAANQISQGANESDLQFVRRLTLSPAFMAATLRGNTAILVGLDRFQTMAASLIGIRINFVDNPAIPGGVRSRYVSAQEFTLPGTNITVVGLPGLTGTNRVVLGSLDTEYWGTDYADDRETIKFGHNDEKGYYWYKINFFSGTQIALPDEIVLGTFTSDITSQLASGLPVSIVSPIGTAGGVLTETTA